MTWLSLKDWRRTRGAACAAAVLLLAPSCAPAQPPAAVPTAEQAVDPATKRLMAANGLFQRNLFKLAAQQYEDFLKDNPQHPQATDARYALAVCDYRLGELEPAITLLNAVVADPKFEQRDEALAVLGYCELSTKQYDKALAHFGELLDKYPQSKQIESAAVYRAQTLYLAGKYADSAAACAAFLQQHPQSAQRPTAIYFNALAQRSLGHFDASLQALDQLQKDFPDSPYQLDALLLSGQALESLGKTDAAIERYRKMLAVAPAARRGDAHYSLGLALFKAGQFDDSIRELSAVLTDSPDSPYAKSAKLQLGLAQLSASKVADARATLSAVAQDDPARAADAHYGLAQCDIAERKFDAARATLDELSKIQPPPANLSQIQFYRAVCLMELAKFEEAAKEFDAFAAAFPKSDQADDALYREAFCQHKLSHFDQSHALCERIAKLPPGSATQPALELDAENLFLLARYPEAEKAFDALAAGSKDEQRQLQFKFRAAQSDYFAGSYAKAIDRLTPLASDPRVGQSEALQPAIFLLGDALLQQGKNAEAAAALKQFLSVSKSDPREARYKLAVAEVRVGDTAGAQATLASLAQEKPDSPWVQRALLESGQLQYKTGKLDDARASLDKLLSSNPGAELAAPAVYLLGWVEFDGKKYPEAAATWKKLLDQYPGDKLAPDAAFQEGVALKESGKPDEAVKVLQAYAAAHGDATQARTARQLAASILTSEGKGNDALALLQQLAKDPQASDAILYDLAWAQKGTKDAAGAEATYRRLLKDHADGKLAPAARAELAEMLYADKRYAEAAALLEAVTADSHADPKVVSAADYRLGWCYQKLNQPDKAAAILSDFADKHPDDPLASSALLQAGLVQADANLLPAAEKTLTDVGRKYPLSPDAAIAALRLAEVQAAENNFDASLQTSRVFLEKNPKNALAYRAEFNAGWAQENLKKFADARAAYQRAIAATNTETAARAQFQIGETFLAEQKFDQAVPALLAVEDVYAYPKWSARALLEAGRAFEQLKQPEQARQQYTQLLTKYKDSPEAGLAQDRLKSLKS